MNRSFSDADYMHMALEQAALAMEANEVPIGAVIVDREGNVLAKAHNLCQTKHSPLLHAEMIALEKACKEHRDWRLSDCTVYVTMEPCPMCAGALIHARIGRIVYGAADARAGACGSLIDLTQYPLEAHPKVSSGILEEESIALLRLFFQNKRVDPQIKGNDNHFFLK